MLDVLRLFPFMIIIVLDLIYQLYPETPLQAK